ncbi:phosphoribosylamine--glycine ligase [Thermodesulfobacteriota bacterium]
MKVLVIGGGGREHALVWKISRSPKVTKIYCAPGNAGISEMATCLPINTVDIEGLVKFAQKEQIDLTIAGPAVALSAGIVDRFESERLRIFGPRQKAAEIESSKSFAKALMEKHGIPTAGGRIFPSYVQAKNHIIKTGRPMVVKADGITAGKGVMLCDTPAKGLAALERIMKKREFGEAGESVIIEDCLMGEEASFLAFTDGKTVLPLPSAQEHRPACDDDKGSATGGMGACSPAPVVDSYMHKKIMAEIMLPAVQAMAQEGRPYRGVLSANLMITGDRPAVLGFNCHWGEPVAQSLLLRIKTDIVPVLEAVIDEKLHESPLEIDERPSVCVVMAAGGYPGSYKKGAPISGLKNASRMKDIAVFHAGTAAKNKDILTSRGRVLGVTALGNSLEKSINRAYAAVSKISWKGVHYREDIGKKALRWLQQPPRVGIVMGSDSDLEVMEGAVGILKKFAIPYEMTVASAHRSPQKAVDFASKARDRGMKVIIAGAGHAAHLAGVLAAHTSLPVIGVPIDSSCLQGLDALLSTVQMPPGVPVATVSIGKSGAKNAAILAAQILAVSDPLLTSHIDAFKKQMEEQVADKAKKINKL